MTKVLLREWGALRVNILIGVGAAEAMAIASTVMKMCIHGVDEVLF